MQVREEHDNERVSRELSAAIQDGPANGPQDQERKRPLSVRAQLRQRVSASHILLRGGLPAQMSQHHARERTDRHARRQYDHNKAQLREMQWQLSARVLDRQQRAEKVQHKRSRRMVILNLSYSSLFSFLYLSKFFSNHFKKRNTK